MVLLTLVTIRSECVFIILYDYCFNILDAYMQQGLLPTFQACIMFLHHSVD